MKSLAEAIILQGLEDIYDSRYRAESLSFFSGTEFRVCAKMAGMSIEQKIKLLTLVRKISKIPHIALLPEKRRREFSPSRPLQSNQHLPHRRPFRIAGL